MTCNKDLRRFALLLVFVLSLIVLDRGNPAILQVIGIGDEPSHLLAVQPYSIKTGKDGTGLLSMSLQYSAWQNATIVIEPYNLLNGEKPDCIEQVAVIPLSGGGAAPAENIITAPFCSEKALDLSPYLQAGNNQIIIKVRSSAPDIALYVSPQLFGTHLPSTLACLGLFAVAAAGVFHIARRAGLNAATAAIAVAGMGYYALWLHLRPNLLYTNDLPGHLGYIRYMVDHQMSLYGYDGHESWHPPVYYLLAAGVFTLFDASHVVGPLTAARMFGLVLYMIFCLYGLRTLHDATEKKGLAYSVGALLIAFWPIGINLATNINNDIAIYAAWGATFYYLARWYRQHGLASLQLALILLGVTFTLKSSAIVPAGILGLCVLYALATQRLAWRQLFQGKSLLAGGALALGLLINVGKPIYLKVFYGRDTAGLHFGGSSNDVYPPAYFTHFGLQDFIAHPFVTFEREPGFLNYFLKTMLYGEPGWNTPGLLYRLPPVINGLLVAFLCITLCGLIMSFLRNRRCFGEWMPYLLSVALALAGSMAFTLMEHCQFCQNFRYVVPMLPPLVVLFVYGMENARTIAFGKTLYWAGMLVGVSLPVAAAALFLVQFQY